jgi:hypothetical protein
VDAPPQARRQPVSLREPVGKDQVGTVAGRTRRWYVPAAVNGWRRSYAIVGGLTAGLLLTACGGGTQQYASEPGRTYTVEVQKATFPSSQTLSEHSHLVIAVRNAGTKAIPNVAVTICNVTCRYPAPPGAGTSVAPFATVNRTAYEANRSRQVWVVERSPGVCNLGCGSGPEGGGGEGGAVTSDANTWALGKLNPGATKTFDWKVTAVDSGTHVVAWQVEAGLGGKPKAVLSDGSVPQGSFSVTVSGKPVQSYVDNSGKIVTTR